MDALPVLNATKAFVTKRLYRFAEKSQPALTATAEENTPNSLSLP
jgi:hypothetical protein